MQHLGGVATGGGDALVNGEDLLVDVEAGLAGLCDDFDLLKHLRVLMHEDVAEVGLLGLAGEVESFDGGGVAHHGGFDGVSAWGEVGDFPLSEFVAHGTTQHLGALFESDGSVGDGFVGGLVDEDTDDGDGTYPKGAAERDEEGGEDAK